jgi:hypothetical protein
MLKYKIYKVFDCQNMPEDIKQLFFDLGADMCLSNGSCYEWHFEKNSDLTTESKQIQDWLLNNGAELKDKSVLIRYWW